MTQININLLPKKAARDFSLSLKQWKTIISIASVVIVLVFIGGSFLIWNQKEAAAKEQTEWDQKLAVVNSQIAGGDEVVNKVEGLSEQLDSIKGLLENRSPWSEVLKELASLTPSDVQLINLTGETNGKMSFSATTTDYHAAATFVKGLDGSSLFKNVELTSAGLTEVGDKFSVGFNVNLSLDSSAFQNNSDNSTSN